MDNEAGLEHISRRTTSNISSLLIVVNDNPISLNTAKSIIELSTKLRTSIEKLYIITNMVKNERKDELMRRIKDLDVEYLGDIPYDDLLGDAVFHNIPLADLKGSTAVERISKILDKIGG
jgi:CO dehydrogenase maturation factor